MILFSDNSRMEVTKIVSIPESSLRKLAVVGKGGCTFFFSEKGWGLGEALGASLVMVPEKRTGYVNVWKNEDIFGVIHSTVHYSLEQANAERTTSCSGKKKTLLAQLTFEFELQRALP